VTAPVDPGLKRLRTLTPGELADEAGVLKAQLAELAEKLDGCKAEALRRGLREAEGKLFRLVMSPPGTQRRLDREHMEQELGSEFVARYTSIIETDWKMRISARVAGDGKSEPRYS
jgi:hypothetical protein